MSQGFDENIAAKFFRVARTFPHAPAIISDRGEVRYEQLSQNVARLAAEIRNICPGDPVALRISHGEDSITSLLACWAAGCTAIPLPTSPTTTQLQRLLGQSNASLIIAEQEFCSQVNSTKPAATKVVDYGMLTEQAESHSNEASLDEASLEGASLEGADPNEAIVIFTSGSTGNPKGVVHSHSSMLFNGHVHQTSLRLEQTDRALLLAHWNTISGITDLLRMLLTGGALIPVDLSASGLTGVTESIQNHRPTIVHFVPTVFRRLATQHDHQKFFESIRILHLGGEAVTQYDFDLFKKLMPDECLLLNNLGCAEVPTFRQSFLTKDSCWTGSTVPLNEPVDGKRVVILTLDSDAPVENGGEGEIAIESRFTANGYWHQPDLSLTAFKRLDDGQTRYRTGDRGRIRDDGILEYLGRNDGQVKILGQKVNLTHIESLLNRRDEIDESAVVKSSDDGTDYVVAFVSVNSNRQFEKETMVEQVQQEVGVRIRVVTMDSLPTLPNGKIDRAKITALASNGATSESKPAIEERLSSTELQLKKVWQQCLPNSDVRKESNFFSLGGDSLAMFECINRIQQVFGKELSVASFLDRPTLSGVADSIYSSTSTDSPTLVHQLSSVPGAPSIVFVGFAGTSVAVERLSADYRLLVVNLRETGLFELHIDQAIDSVVDELRASQLLNVHAIVGFSYPGLVAFALGERLAREQLANPHLLLVEPSFPLPSTLVGVTREKVRKIVRRLHPKYARLSQSKIQAKLDANLGLTREEQAELRSRIVRRNRAKYVPQNSLCDMTLVGRTDYLRKAPAWDALVEGRFQTMEIEAKSHREVTEPRIAQLWLDNLHKRLSNFDSHD